MWCFRIAPSKNLKETLNYVSWKEGISASPLEKYFKGTKLIYNFLLIALEELATMGFVPVVLVFNEPAFLSDNDVSKDRKILSLKKKEYRQTEIWVTTGWLV